MSDHQGPLVPIPPPPPPISLSASVKTPSGEVSAYELSLGVLKPSQILAERYQIEAQIGQGGMGKVYRAQDLNLMRSVVIKVAHNEVKGEEKEQARFRREALKMASLSHPNIVAIYDYGEQEGVHYLVMELVEGGLLKDELKEYGPFSAKRFFEVMIQLLEGLSSAHKQHVIHRDIKPSNLMWDTRSELIKILDFGLARGVEGDTLTGTGHVHGSIQYMAPEQIRGDHQDERTDIYSIGVLAYQLIAGQLPFLGENTVELMFHKLQYRPKPVLELLAHDTWVTPELSSLIETCLEIEPADRVRDANECLEQFKQIQAHILRPESSVGSQTTEIVDRFAYEGPEQLNAFTSIDLLKNLAQRPQVLTIFMASIFICLVLSSVVTMSLFQNAQPKVKPRKMKLNASSSIQKSALTVEPMQTIQIQSESPLSGSKTTQLDRTGLLEDQSKSEVLDQQKSLTSKTNSTFSAPLSPVIESNSKKQEFTSKDLPKHKETKSNSTNSLKRNDSNITNTHLKPTKKAEESDVPLLDFK